LRTFVVYILSCSDGSFYTGITSSLYLRLAGHNEGIDSHCYTYARRPVRLMWAQPFADETEALTRERQIKGWSRAKKEALIRSDWEGLRAASRKTKKTPRGSSSSTR
jgi:putative endonuclease